MSPPLHWKYTQQHILYPYNPLLLHVSEFIYARTFDLEVLSHETWSWPCSNMTAFCMCTPVTGSTKVTEWFTVPWAATGGNLATQLDAHHSSEWMIVPGATWAWMIGSSVAAFLCWTTCMNPTAGVWEVSTKPNTHTSWVGGLPQWFCICPKKVSVHCGVLNFL